MIRENEIGRNHVFISAYGKRSLTYCDHTASGPQLEFIENFITRQVRGQIESNQAGSEKVAAKHRKCVVPGQKKIGTRNRPVRFDPRAQYYQPTQIPTQRHLSPGFSRRYSAMRRGKLFAMRFVLPKTTPWYFVDPALPEEFNC